MSRLGPIDPFDDCASDQSSAKEGLSAYLRVNQNTDDDKVLQALLSVIGLQSQACLKSPKAPESLSDKTFGWLKEVLQDHLAPQPSAQTAKFYKQCQLGNEVVADF